MGSVEAQISREAKSHERLGSNDLGFLSDVSCSELKKYASVDLSSCKIVGYGVLLVGDIGYPIVGVDVVDAEQVEPVETEPDVLEGQFLVALLVVDETIGHTDIHTFVGRSPEGVGLKFLVRRRERQAVGIGQLERHLPTGGSREIVGEEQVDGIFLVGGQRDALTAELHAGVHEGEA